MGKLAVNGAAPIRTNKFPAWPKYGNKEKEKLLRVLESGVWGTLGPESRKFEKRFSEYQQSLYGIAVTNGTVSLEIILRALGIGRGDEVIIPPYTFYATASAVLMVGAIPVFADIEASTYNIDPEEIERLITPRTRAVIPVHVAGRPCNMDRIMEIANRHGLYVIEDCAQAHGSEWKGKRVGSIGTAGSFSFQCSKNLCCGEGGFITTNDEAVYERCWSIHNCGRDLKDDRWYSHHHIGTNSRLSEWQAAILDAQLDRLDEQMDIRQKNASYLNSLLAKIDCIEVMQEDINVTRNSHHLFIFKFKPEQCKGLSKELFIKALNAEGIPCTSGYTCLYKHPAFHGEEIRRVLGEQPPYAELYLKNAETAANAEGVWLTQNVLLAGKEDMDDIAEAIIKIYGNVDELL